MLHVESGALFRTCKQRILHIIGNITSIAKKLRTQGKDGEFYLDWNLVTLYDLLT